MKSNRRLPLTVLTSVVLAGAVFACGGGGSTSTSSKEVACTDKTAPGCEAPVTSHTAAPPSATATTAPAPKPSATTPPPRKPSPEAGAPPPTAVKPAPSLKGCMDLSVCCKSLPDNIDRLTCIALSLTGNETACTDGLLVCNGGGLGISSIFQNSNPVCTQLAQCCTTAAADNYQDSDIATCRSYVQTDEESACQTELDSWQAIGECL